VLAHTEALFALEPRVDTSPMPTVAATMEGRS
jgi:hypothetical protein